MTFHSTYIPSFLGPSIEGMGLLQRSLLFSELASVSYHKKETAFFIAKNLGFSHQEFLDIDGSQAFIFESEGDCIISCRGTEPSE